MSYSSIRMNITVGVLFADYTWAEHLYTNLEVEFNSNDGAPTNGDIYEAAAAEASAGYAPNKPRGYAVLSAQEVDPDGRIVAEIELIERLFESDSNSDPEVSSDTLGSYSRHVEGN